MRGELNNYLVETMQARIPPICVHCYGAMAMDVFFKEGYWFKRWSLDLWFQMPNLAIPISLLVLHFIISMMIEMYVFVYVNSKCTAFI